MSWALVALRGPWAALQEAGGWRFAGPGADPAPSDPQGVPQGEWHKGPVG